MHPSDLPRTQQQSQLQVYGGGFSFFCIFILIYVEMIQFDEHIFRIGLVQPPSSKLQLPSRETPILPHHTVDGKKPKQPPGIYKPCK